MVQGDNITLSGANTATASFTAPDVRSANPATVVLQLVTTANGVDSAPDTVSITVKKSNRRPVGQGPATSPRERGHRRHAGCQRPARIRTGTR